METLFPRVGTSRVVRALASMACVVLAEVTVGAQRAIPRPIIRDSAHVRIIEYPTFAPELPPFSMSQRNPLQSSLRELPQAFRVEARPFLDLGGGADGDEEFDATHPYLSATRLSNGVIVVNDRVQLKFFTSTGKFLRSRGRSGGGPGEFTQTMEVCRFRGDSLLVRDIDGRHSVWNSQGDHVRTYPRIGHVASGGCTPNGLVIVQHNARASDLLSTTDLARYRIAHLDGSVARELGLLPSTRGQGGLIWSPSIVPVEDELYVANARSYELTIRSNAGRLRQITRLTKRAAEISDAEWRLRAELQIPKTASRVERQRRVATTIAQKPQGSYPAYSLVRVDAKRRVWIQDFESQSGWTILGADGMLLGRFVLPGADISRTQLVGVAVDHVVVFEEDTDGHVHLRFYRLSRGV